MPQHDHPNPLFHRLQGLANPRPKVLISACLAGQNVRYDGQQKRLGQEKGLGQALPSLASALELVQHCPEMDAGMGVPRAPIHWVQPAQGKPELQWVSPPGARVDDPLHNYRHYPLHAQAENWCRTQQGLSAAIVKARSPSCGSGTTPLRDTEGNVVQLRDGVFTERLKVHFPRLVLVDESYFGSLTDIHWFILGVYLHHAGAEQGEGVDRLRQRLHWPGDLSQFLAAPESIRADGLQQLAGAVL